MSYRVDVFEIIDDKATFLLYDAINMIVVIYTDGVLEPQIYKMKYLRSNFIKTKYTQILTWTEKKIKSWKAILEKSWNEIA